MVPTDRPFTLNDAGCSRAVLRRLQMAGEVRRLVRGVYAHVDLELPPSVRHEALALVMPAGATAVGATAAWAHGLLDTCPRLETAHRPAVGLVEALVATGPEWGLVVYDAALRLGASHLELLQAVPEGHRSMMALADGRALTAAESRLRQAWLSADLPTPTLGHQVAGLRVAVAHPLRAFAATIGPASDALRQSCRSTGWWLTEVDPQRTLDSPIDLLAGHLRREFHRQLLAQVEFSPAG